MQEGVGNINYDGGGLGGGASPINRRSPESSSRNRWEVVQIRSEMDGAFRPQVSRKVEELGYKWSAKDKLHTKEGGNTYKFDTTFANIAITFSDSSSSSSSDQKRKRKRKRSPDVRMMDFLQTLMMKVMQKQEAMQQKFLEAIEKREQDRMNREEAWKRQDMARLTREHHLMAQERSNSSARYAAVIAFLEKITGQTINLPNQMELELELESSRWAKEQVLALIELRSGMERRYQELGPKGPLWEEISAAMQRMGYNRNAKRCKEKWENINKYFKKVKESNKKRPQDSKTCPYFHELDALYHNKSRQPMLEDKHINKTHNNDDVRTNQEMNNHNEDYSYDGEEGKNIHGEENKNMQGLKATSFMAMVQ